MNNQQCEAILKRIKKKKKELKGIGQLPKSPVIAINPFDYTKIKNILCKTNGLIYADEIKAIKYIGISGMQFVCMLGIPNHNFQIVSQVSFVKKTAGVIEKVEKIKTEEHKLQELIYNTS